jgi:hypothetical protein
MTTPTLTHEQATILRAVQLGAVADSDGIPIDLSDLVYPGDDYGRDPYLSDLGKSVLAKYDAEWRTVRTEALVVAIENLEASISRHDELSAGYPARLALMDEDRAVLAELKAALARSDK